MGAFLADEDIPLPMLEELRRRGHDVQLLNETNESAEDEDLLNTERIVLSANRRTSIALHQSTPHHFGFVVCVPLSDMSEVATRVDELVKTQDHLMSSIWLVDTRTRSS